MHCSALTVVKCNSMAVVANFASFASPEFLDPDRETLFAGGLGQLGQGLARTLR